MECFLGVFGKRIFTGVFCWKSFGNLSAPAASLAVFLGILSSSTQSQIFINSGFLHFNIETILKERILIQIYVNFRNCAIGTFLVILAGTI